MVVFWAKTHSTRCAQSLAVEQDRRVPSLVLRFPQVNQNGPLISGPAPNMTVGLFGLFHPQTHLLYYGVGNLHTHG